MHRHRFDAISFIFGAGFVALAGLLSLGGQDILDGDAVRWMGAGALLLSGLVLLFGSKSRSTDDRRR